MAEKVITKRHRWTKMTYVPVAVAGFHESGEPACFPMGETLEGINCFDCGEGITATNETDPCLGSE